MDGPNGLDPLAGTLVDLDANDNGGSTVYKVRSAAPVSRRVILLMPAAASPR